MGTIYATIIFREIESLWDKKAIPKIESLMKKKPKHDLYALVVVYMVTFKGKIQSID